MKVAFVLLILLLSLACNYSPIEETKLQPLPQSTISSTPIPQYENLSDVNEDIVYGQVLESIAYGRDIYDESSSSYQHTDWFDPRVEGNWLVVRRQTISPENLDEIKSIPNLPEDLVNDFIEKNKTKEKLREDGYDVKFGVEITEFKGALESLFKMQDRQEKKRNNSLILKAAVGISRVGFSKNHKQSLVYVEFYHPATGFQKKYCLTTWKREGIGIRIEDVKIFN